MNYDRAVVSHATIGIKTLLLHSGGARHFDGQQKSSQISAMEERVHTNDRYEMNGMDV